MVDIDYFKRVNDKYGHDVGDSILIELSKVLLKNIRKIDILSRWGGEEFVLLMPNIGADEAYIAAERLRLIVQDTMFTKGINITLSMGITELENIDSSDSLIKRADDVQYKAKDNGRNNVQVL